MGAVDRASLRVLQSAFVKKGTSERRGTESRARPQSSILVHFLSLNEATKHSAERIRVVSVPLSLCACTLFVNAENFKKI